MSFFTQSGSMFSKWRGEGLLTLGINVAKPTGICVCRLHDECASVLFFGIKEPSSAGSFLKLVEEQLFSMRVITLILNNSICPKVFMKRGFKFHKSVWNKTRGVYLLEPVSVGHYFTWPELSVAQSRFGRGVFASKDILPGTCFPVLGEPVSQSEFDQRHSLGLATHVFRLIDGTPAWNPDLDAVGAKGLSILLMINEPSPKTKANCLFTSNTVMVATKIAKGQELTVHYGQSYKREYKVGQRAIQKYKEPKNSVFVVRKYMELIGREKR